MKNISLVIATGILSFFTVGVYACQDFELSGKVLTITCPGVNLEGEMLDGAVRADQPDVNTGKPATNLQYPNNRNIFEGAHVYLCRNGNGWTCGSGSLRRILQGQDDRPFADGVFHSGKAVITLPAVVDPAQLTGVVVFHNGVRGWLHLLR